MDLEQVRDDTRAAYAEAGVDEPDLTYITEAFLTDLAANAESTEDDALPAADTGATIAQWGSLYFDVVFTGLRFYGTVGGDRYICNSNWRRYGGWSQRALVGRCSDRNSLIWRIG
jgi:hypothetical protein